MIVVQLFATTEGRGEEQEQPLVFHNSRAIICPNTHDMMKGYTSIKDINADQQDELVRLRSKGDNQHTPKHYVFTLCPFTTFDTSQEQLQVLLGGSTIFSCGTEGNSVDECILNGGSIQMEVSDDDPYSSAKKDTTIMGLTFTNFSLSSILATSSGVSQASLYDVVWRDFDAPYICKQTSPTGHGYPIQIDIMKASITNGVGLEMFSNDGGFLSMTDIDVTDSTAGSFLSSHRGGVSFLERSNFTASSFDSVTTTNLDSKQFVETVTVQNLDSVKTVFHVTDADSVLRLIDVDIIHNNFLHGRRIMSQPNHNDDNDPSDAAATGVMAVNGSRVEVTSCRFTDNIGFNFGFRAQGEGTNIQLSMVEMIANQGTSDTVSSLLCADDNGTVTGVDLKFEGNQKFSGGHAFASTGGSWQMDRSCIIGGNNDAVASISQDSFYSASNMYIDQSVVSHLCPTDEDGGRLAIEYFRDTTTNTSVSPAECFMGGVVCTVTCAPLTTTVTVTTTTPQSCLRNIPKTIREKDEGEDLLLSDYQDAKIGEERTTSTTNAVRSSIPNNNDGNENDVSTAMLQTHRDSSTIPLLEMRQEDETVEDFSGANVIYKDNIGTIPMLFYTSLICCIIGTIFAW